MGITKIQLKAIEARRHGEPGKQKRIEIKHNTTMLSVKENQSDTLNVEFRYSVSYGSLGIINLEGMVIYDCKKEIGLATQIVKSWSENNKLPQEIAEKVHNAILAHGTFEIINLSKKINLPPPVKIEIPQIKINKGKGSAEADVPGPEVA